MIIGIYVYYGHVFPTHIIRIDLVTGGSICSKNENLIVTALSFHNDPKTTKPSGRGNHII